MIILAADPGARGAICYTLDCFGGAQVLSLGACDLVQTFLHLQAISHLVPHEAPRIAFIEENTGFVAGSPRSGASMFTFGRHTGRLEGILAALGFAITRIRPRAWQAGLSAPPKRVGEPSSKHKARLASFAREIAPHLSGKITRDNADAVLILRYAIKVNSASADTTSLTTNTAM